MLIKLIKGFKLLFLKLILKLKSILSLAKSKGDYIKLINVLSTLNKEAIKLLKSPLFIFLSNLENFKELIIKLKCK
jgi:hypothetical protein